MIYEGIQGGSNSIKKNDSQGSSKCSAKIERKHLGVGGGEAFSPFSLQYLYPVMKQNKTEFSSTSSNSENLFLHLFLE